MIPSNSRGSVGFRVSGEGGLVCSTASSVVTTLLPVKGLLAGGHLIEHHAKGKKIGSRIEFLAARLFRRHVNRGAGDYTYCGERVFHRSFVAGPQPVVAQQLGQPEIQDFRLAARSEEDVGRLDIAMDDPLGVGSGERVGHMNGDIEEFVDIHGLAPDALLQALALQLFHDDEGMAVVVFDFVDGADAGMVQQRGGAGLALKALHGLVSPVRLSGRNFMATWRPSRVSSAS